MEASPQDWSQEKGICYCHFYFKTEVKVLAIALREEK
jgi:ferredoxin-thioredoxin reductase catalytic subunit